MPVTDISESEWYLVQCKPRQDERAELNLVNQSLLCFRPLHKVERIRHGKRVLLDEPLFPGYLFVSLRKDNPCWATIRSTRGVNRLVSFAGQPARVDDSIIQSIHQRLQPQVKPAFQAGQRVRITEGPFRELEAIFLRADGSERAILLLSLLQRQHQLRLPWQAIAKH